MEVPDTPCPLDDNALAFLREVFTEEVILSSGYHGVDVYVQVLDYVMGTLH